MVREREIKRLPHTKPSLGERIITFFQKYLPILCASTEAVAVAAEDIILPAPIAAKANIATEIAVAGLEAAASTGLDQIANAGKKEPLDHKDITYVADKIEAAGHDVIFGVKIGTEVATSIATANMEVQGLEIQAAANIAVESAAGILNGAVDTVVAEGEDLAVRFVDRINVVDQTLVRTKI